VVNPPSLEAHTLRLNRTVGREKNHERPRNRALDGASPDAGPFQREIGSVRLHQTAAGKAVKTVQTYTEAVQWLLRPT